jgi:hypothetical protein
VGGNASARVALMKAVELRRNPRESFGTPSPLTGGRLYRDHEMIVKQIAGNSWAGKLQPMYIGLTPFQIMEL